MPIGELFTISISPSPSKSMGCIDDAPWPSIRAGSSAAASATMLLRLILEHAATRGHDVVCGGALGAYRGLRAAIFVVPLRIARRRQSNFFRRRIDGGPAPREGLPAAAAALERC